MSSSSTNIPSLRRTGGDLNIQNNDGTMTAFFSSAITDSVIINNKTDITERTSLDDIFGDDSEIQMYSNTNPFISFESAECKADDSSGSYHTALCSETSEHFSNCSETFEVTKEDLSPEQRDTEPAASYKRDFSQSSYKTEHLFYKASKNRNTDENTGQLTYSNQDNEQYSEMNAELNQDNEMTSNSGSWKKSEQRFNVNTNKGGDQQYLSIAMRDKPHLSVVSTDLNLSNSRTVSRHCVKDPAVSGRDRSGIGTERQAQLSLSSKNRNIPEHSSTELPVREEQPGMTGCSDSACRFSSTTQEEKKQNSTAHKRSTFSETNRRRGADCTSETSSMGSEFDEADNEVKCLTDLAFKSLSYPQDDYLAIYNSSYYRSSTNVSQPSTEGSCGVNAWPAYADFRGSGINYADLPENKDPVDRFEIGNFECVDVVLENQDQLNTSCSKRTVPKRQIQLKRQEGNVFLSRGLAECQPTSRPFERHAQDIFIRQHSTPAVIQGESNKHAEVLDENYKKQKLHKSVSLDETSSKAKIASCLIKNVLSKKMQHEHKLQLERGDVQDAEPSSQQSPSSVCDIEFKYSNTPSRGNLYYSSGVTSDGSFSSEHVQMDSLMQSKFDSSKANKVSKLIMHNSLNSKTQEKPVCKYGFQSYEKSLTRDSDAAIITSAHGNKSRIGIPWSNRKLFGDNNHVNDVAKPIACTNREKKLGDSESYVAKDSLGSAPAEPASVWSAYESPKNHEHEAKTDDTHHFIRNVFTSKTPEITLRPRNRTEKKNHTFSIARLLSPNTEGKSSAKQNSEPLFKSRATTCMDQQQSEKLSQLEVKDSNLKNKPKAPMHKVRDVRKLVKHTYNLSFKASAIISLEPADQEQTLEPPTYPPPLLVECRAISRQDSMLDPTSPPPECKAISRLDSMLDPTSPPPDYKAISRQDSMLDPTSPLPLLMECKAISRQDSMLDPTSPPPECKAVSRQNSILDATSPLPLLMECKAISRQDSMLDPTSPLPLLMECKAISRQDGMLDPTSPPPDYKAISRQDSMLDPTSPLPLLMECKAISRQDSMLDPTSPLPLLMECKAVSRQDSMLDPTSPLPLLTECKAISRQDSMLDPTSPPPESKAICRQDSMLDPTSPPPECKAVSRQDSKLDPTSPPPECKTISRQDSMVDKSQQLIVEKQLFKSTTQKVLPCQNREYASVAVPKTCDFEESESYSITKKDLKEESMIPPNHNLSDTSRNSQIYCESVPPMEVYCAADQLDKGSETSPPNREGHKPNPQCLPSKNSHSVSMIIKEKGFQADIGLFDSEPIHSPPKHVNTLEVPLQTCTSKDKVKEENSVQTSNSLSINMNPASATELSSETPQPQVKHHQSTKDYKLKWQIPGCVDHNITSDDPPEYEEKQSSRQFVRTQVSPGQTTSENPTRSFKKCSSDGYISPPPQTLPPLPPSGGPPAKVQDLSEALLTKSQPTKRPQLQAMNSEPLNCVTIPPQVQQKSPLNPCSFQPGSLTNSNFQPRQSFDDKPFQKETSPDKLCGSPSYRQVASPKKVQEARPQFMCSPIGFPSPYATERETERLSFAENNSSMPCFQYHQSRRKVLYDPETGKYFYIEVPVQPQRKMLYDPETGQYVEVLIPQQCLAQSSVYQPPASPYSSFMNPGMYGSPYMPPHAASPLRHPDVHNQNLPQNNLQLSGTANQALKPASQNTQPAEPSCLESMHYIPTGIAASTNPTQPAFYQNAPSSSPGKSASVALPIQQHPAHVAGFTEG